MISVLKIRTICHAPDLWKFAWSWHLPPRELWDPLSKTVHSKCNFIWNKGPVNVWNDRKFTINLYVWPVNIFPNFDIVIWCDSPAVWSHSYSWPQIIHPPMNTKENQTLDEVTCSKYTWCQLCCHRWHSRLSLWQPASHQWQATGLDA